MGELDVAAILQLPSELKWRTIVCVRRQVPDWWERVKLRHPESKFIHLPLRASKDPGFAADLWRVSRRDLPKGASPILLFCKEGRHRSGMVSGLLQTNPYSAVAAYIKRAGIHARLSEMRITFVLARRLQHIARTRPISLSGPSGG